MKYLLLLPFLLFIGCSSASRLELSADESLYQRSENHNKSKSESFTLIREWIARNNLIATHSDRSSGTIIIKSSVPLTTGATKVLYGYLFTIRTTDNRVELIYEIKTNEFGGYPPEDSMKELKAYYDFVTQSLLDYINGNS